MFKRAPCLVCEELKKQVVFLQATVDRLMVQTWPKVEASTEEPAAVENDPSVAERITFGDG